MSENKKLMNYEIRTVGVRGDVLKILNFIQNEFIVSSQTAKKMIEPETLLVHHLTNTEAKRYAEKYQSNGLLCEIVVMENE